MRSLKKYRNRCQLYFDYLLGRSKVKGHPLSMQLEVTNHCNLNCYTCPRKKLKREKGYMSFQLFEKIIESEKDYLETVLLFHMGEPLLHPDLAKMVKYATTRKIRTIIFTNGVLLTQKKAEELFVAGLDLLVISFDGLEQDTYEEVRKGSSYHVVLDNINHAVMLCKKRNFKTKIQLHYVVSSKTRDEAKRFYDKMHKEKNLEIRMKPFINTGGMGDVISEGTKPRANYPCFMLYREPAISWDGKMFPCCVDLLGEKVLGDVTKKTVLECWNSEETQTMRRRHKNGEFINEKICSYCNAYCVHKSAYAGVIFLHDFTIRKLVSIIDGINLKTKFRSLFKYVK